MKKNRVLAIAALSWVGVALIAGCGESDGGASDAELRSARAEGAQEARQAERIRNLEKRLKSKERVASNAPAGETTVTVPSAGAVAAPSIPAGARDCGPAYGGGSASCPFVVNVSDDYLDSGGSESFESYSPVTGQTYLVTCNGDAPTVCTAGQNAVIYIP